MCRFYALAILFVTIGDSGPICGEELDGATARTLSLRDVSSTPTGFRIVYDATGKGASAGSARLRLFRTAESRFDRTTAREVASTTITIPARGRQAWHWHPPAHVQRIDPARPYLFFTLEESGEKAPAATVPIPAVGLRKHTVAVIVHGVIVSGQPSAWTRRLAALLWINGYDDVLVLNWSERSRSAEAGIIEQVGIDAATALRQRIEGWPGGPPTSVDIHWIGFSRGMGVVSSGLQEWKRQLATGQILAPGAIKVTALDPHPASLRDMPHSSFNPFSLYGWLIGINTWFFEMRADDPAITFPADLVTEAELFFQRNPWYRLQGQGSHHNAWGDTSLSGIEGVTITDWTGLRLWHQELPELYLLTWFAPQP